MYNLRYITVLFSNQLQFCLLFQVNTSRTLHVKVAMSHLIVDNHLSVLMAKDQVNLAHLDAIQRGTH